MLARILAGFALVLLPSLAKANAGITEFPDPHPGLSARAGADSLPSPERAASISARNTFIPLGVGAAACVLGSSPAWGGGNDFGPAGTGVFVIGATVATVGLLVGPSAGYSYGGLSGRGTAVGGDVRRHNAALSRASSLRLELCVTPTTHAPGLALRAGF